jgi:hypothetical protein
VIDQGEAPQSRQVHFAAHDFFATLGIDAARGRIFTQDEDRRGAPVVAVLSDRYWRRVFNADANVVGRMVTVAGTPAAVIGILPRGFRGLQLSEAPDLYLPLHAAGDLPMAQPLFFTRDPLGPAGSAWIRIVGRLRPGETPAGAAARIFRAAGDPGAAMREAMATATALDPRVTLQNMSTLDAQIGRQMNPQRFGIYVLVGIGLVAGLVLATLGARLIRSLLYQVEPLDPLVLATVAAGIFGLALLVSLRPALEATRVDLSRSLREE